MEELRLPEMPDVYRMTGVPLHLAWAKTVTARIFEELPDAVQAVVAAQNAKTSAQLSKIQAALGNLARHKGAVWWIDQRFTSTQDIVTAELARVEADIEARAARLAEELGGSAESRRAEAEAQWLQANGFVASN